MPHTIDPDTTPVPPPHATPPHAHLPLTDALDAIDAAGPAAARVRATADLLVAFGFEHVAITLRDAALGTTVAVTLGACAPGDPINEALQSLTGAVWRRRLAYLERTHSGDVYVLDGTDQWVSREFFGTDPATRLDATRWIATDLLLGLVRGHERELLGIVTLATPRSGERPGADLLRDLATIMRHLGARLAYDALGGLAQQRAERLQRLQEAGAALARSLDEHEIMRELARQALRVTRADGVSISFPDLKQDMLITAHAQFRGVDRQRGPSRLGDGIIAEVARTGRPVRVGDREADRARERAGLALPLSMYDIVGDASPAASVLAVPLIAGIQLVGVLVVFAASREVYSAEDQEVLATMASQAATAIANARRYAESERERRQTEALAEVARAVSESLRLGEVLRLILRHAVALLGAEGACIALRHDDYLHIVAAVGAADVLAGVHLPVASSLLGHAVTTHERIVSNDFQLNPNASRAVLHLADIQRTVIAPLVSGDGTIGAIAVINRDEPFRDDDGRVLQRLADHVAVAIVNARLFEEVERATREWKLAFDSIASGVVVLDESRKVRRCNARAAELCAGSIAALLGARFGEALLGDAGARDDHPLSLLISRSLESELPARDILVDTRNARLFEILVAPHPDGCVVTFDDVTSAHRLAEQHRRVLETVTDAIVITALDGRIAFANPAAHDLFAHSALLGAKASEFVAPESLASVQAFERNARSGLTQSYECTVLRSDGAKRLVAVSSAPMVEVGKVTGTVASLRDLTDQRAEALALARSESRYQQLVESASDAIFTVDIHGNFTSVNQTILTESGLTREELIGAPCTSLVDPLDVPAVERLVAHIFGGGKDRLELRYRARGGVVRVGTVTTAPIFEDAVVVGALGIMRDITEQEILRESTAQQERLASLGRMLSGVANELNNPLASLLAVAELEAATMAPQATHQPVIAQILNEAQRASRIVAQLLESTRTGAAERGAVDLNRVVRGVLDLHGFHFRVHSIDVELELTPALPEISVDAVAMQQVVLNLLANAEEALRDWHGPRVVRVATRHDGEQVLLSVSDSGPGVSAHPHSRIFEPRFSTRGVRGRGFGLTVARAIVERHGGSLRVESAAGQGATFALALPLQAAPVASAYTSGGHRAIASVPSRRLLLIEDEATLRAAISRYLTRDGYHVDVAAGGREALTMLETQRYNLILLDLRMQDMPGDEVYRAIEALDVEQAQQVLFITGDLHRQEAADFVRSTGRSALAKPFQLAELEARIVQLIEPSADDDAPVVATPDTSA